MLQLAEPVEIFHQFQFFRFIEFQSVTFGKLVGIIGNSLVYITSCNTINFGHIAINQYTLSTKFHNCIVNTTYIKWFIHLFLLLINIMRQRPRPHLAKAVELVTQAGGNLRGRLPKVARRVRRRGQGANQIFSTRITVSDMGREDEVTSGE